MKQRREWWLRGFLFDFEGVDKFGLFVKEIGKLKVELSVFGKCFWLSLQPKTVERLVPKCGPIKAIYFWNFKKYILISDHTLAIFRGSSLYISQLAGICTIAEKNIMSKYIYFKNYMTLVDCVNAYLIL